MQLVYKAVGYKTGRSCNYDYGSILTTEKPDDVDKPCGYIEDGLYKPFSLNNNKDVYLNPFTNRWE